MTENSTPMYMPVAPAYGYGGGGGFGNDFGGGWWILLLLLLAGGGMWGGLGGMGGMMMGGMWGMDGLYPWLNNSQNINGGFRDQMLNSTLTGIQNSVTSGFGDVQTALCGGFAGVNATINGAQNAIAQQLYTNQISDLERSYAAQTATMQGFNGVQGQLAQCCCENRTTSMQNTRDIIDSQTRGTQAILDKLCALELDGVKGQLAQAQRENVGLQNQLNMATMAASQTAQTSQITDAVYNRLATCPVGTVPVFGEQAIFRCNNNNNCGCGCGAMAA